MKGFKPPTQAFEIVMLAITALAAMGWLILHNMSPR